MNFSKAGSALRYGVPSMAAAVVLTGASLGFAGTTPEGFFDEFLVLGAYLGPGCSPTLDQAKMDYLCDGNVSEDAIVPEEGLELSTPVTDALDCTGALVPALMGGLHANAHLGGGGGPIIERSFVVGDTLDHDAFYSAADNVMAYAWVYVNNTSGAVKTYTMGIASDDSLYVSINGVEVFAGVGAAFCRGYGGAGVIQNRFPVTLVPGGNLIQFKTWDGCCGWGFRARLEDTVNCAPVVSGEGDIEVGADPIDVSNPPAVRTIVTSGSTQADITIAINNGGAAYTLEETFDAGWAISNVVPAGTTGAGSVKWTNVTAANLSYRLTRSGDFPSAQGKVTGKITLNAFTIPVGGDSQIGGGIPPFVYEVLLTPAYTIAGPLDGCTVTGTEINGAWITDGGTLTDTSIIPAEGLEYQVDFSGGSSQSDGLAPGLAPEGEDLFWVTPGDALGGSRLVKVTSGDGYFNWQRPDIYNGDPNDAMNVAYFYVVNTNATKQTMNLAFGSDDSGGVRVNGFTALTVPTCRGNPGFADRFQITLDPGKNLIACYTFEAQGGFDMSLRFEDANFQPLSVKVTLDPAGYNPSAHANPGPPKLYFVPEILVTPAYELPAGVTGCNVAVDMINGDWVADGVLTDANIVPEEGLELVPEFGGASQAMGQSGTISAAAQDRFWLVPGDQFSGGRLVKVAAGGGTFNWQAAAIYDADVDLAMNVAYFYVVNPDASPRCARFGFGSDDSGGVRVNGRPVHAITACRANNVYGDKFVAQLDPGKNLVACYTFENGGGFDMTIRFEDNEGRPLALSTTLDPSGYNPANHPVPDPSCKFSQGDIGAYTDLGFITKFFVPEKPMVLLITSGTLTSGMTPDQFITIDGNAPDLENVFEGAPAMPGIDPAFSTEILGNPACGFTPLVLFDGVSGRGATAGDPGLFNGESFYGSIDNYTSSLFFFLENKTNSNQSVFIGFTSDDAAALYQDGELILEFLSARGYSAANTIDTGPVEAVLVPGKNLFQLAYVEAQGGSGARVAVYGNCVGSMLLDPAKVVVVAPDVPPVTTIRSMAKLDCSGVSTVTLTFDVTGGGSANVNLVENLPPGLTGSNPSKGSFNGGGTTLTFNGQVVDNDTLTYQVNGATPTAAYCLSTASGRPVQGQSQFRAGTDFCGDISQGLFIDCGGRGRTDDEGRVWLEDTLTNPSQFLTGPNAFVAQFGLLTQPVDTDFDPVVTAGAYPSQIFRAERWNDGPIEYTITSLPAGTYDVVLLFMEGCCSDNCDTTLEDPAQSAGACRVFDVTVNGEFPTNEDSPHEGGADGDQYSQMVACDLVLFRGTHLSKTVAVNDGTIVVRVEDLGAGINPPENASIKGIAITRSGGPPTGVFHRGDADENGALQLTDAIRILGVLFLGQGVIPCNDAADADDNGSIQLTDAIRILGVLFLGQGVIPPPATPNSGPCGLDPTPDAGGSDLGCISYTRC